MTIQMENPLTSIDISVLVMYFILLISVGFYSMAKHNRSTIKGYFLANRQMTWLCVGASLYATNIGAEHFIGLASSGAAKGLSVAAFEIGAIGVMQLLGWVFLPVFTATGVATLPEYMHRRFGGQRIRTYIACLYLLLYILTKISVNIYAASLFINYAFAWNIYLSILFILALTALCTISGGLATVMYTDTVQAIIMISGGVLVMILSYNEIGGLSNLYRQYLNATPTIINDHSIGNITTLGTCNKPTMKSFQILRSASDPDMPWLGFFLGHTPNIIWYWCSDQMMVQRVLAAKSISHARGGTILTGYLKILSLFMIIIPGMISRALYPDIVACNQPSTCQAICNSQQSCTNIAYPTLILRILPHGFKGIMLAAMLAALISGLTSIFNSASTLFTVDIYPNLFFSYRKTQIKTRELMIVGRLFVVLMTIFGLIWIPVVIHMQGSDIYVYMQQVIGFFAPPIACVYLLAVLWTRTNECGAFAGLMVGFIFGLLRMIFEFSKKPPLCGEEDTRFWFIRHIHFMYYAAFLFWTTFLICVIVSLCTEPPTKEQLFRATYWTRNEQTNSDHLTLNEKNNRILLTPSQSIQHDDITSPSEARLITNKNVEDLSPEVNVSSILIRPSSKLYINQEIDDDPSHNTYVTSTENPFEDMKQNIFESPSYTTTNNSKNSRYKKAQCSLCQLLSRCCSWFCGLEHDHDDDHQEYHSAAIENGNFHEKQHSNSLNSKERSIIKWLLNGNLIIIILVEIIIFTIFSLPVKYTFLRE